MKRNKLFKFVYISHNHVDYHHQERTFRNTNDEIKKTENDTKSTSTADLPNADGNFISEIKNAALEAQNHTGFIYEPTSGLYYDSKTGYYYNAVSLN